MNRTDGGHRCACVASVVLLPSICASDLMYSQFGSRFVIGHGLAGISDDRTPVVITHRYPIVDAAEAFRVAGDKTSGAIRVVIRTSQSPEGSMMPWDFETEPEFQEKLDWVDAFVHEEVEPLDLVWPGLAFTPLDDTRRKVVDPLKDEVRRHELWATHLAPDLGGQGYGQLKLALMNEILGRSQWAPIVFGCPAPDTGNAEIIAHYGTPE